ncbi:hybrid sensor histidine kinase/response regulator [Noviherbaspirillum suwonense]|uniref:histidine kinase n=1 Tax=Noviherbaspirillum suwonense TaxID=1224511 RepID=A0ABY1PW21_9BURK|nr:ATP-binding protein [Noviherbaspirillum suwonense]SMP49645.1 Signal transduction histidine kinase [Noviherbaspirillum suwonense]
MLQFFGKSISRKLMLVVLSTTFTGLLLSALAMLAYDIRTYQSAWLDDLRTQADLIARSSAPALTFNDPRAATENLALLKSRPAIVEAAIYGPNGKLFASYAREGERGPVPPAAEPAGYRIDGEHIVVYQQMVANRELVLTVYLRARYELMDRLRNYALILGTVMAGSLALAGLISLWLQAAFTRPILAVTEVAREVMQRRDFSLRVKKTTSDEIGVLVDAFNDMLNEVGQRAAALEESNRILEHETAERRSAEQALRVADRRKDEFLATLAHELRNPLAPLMNGLEILRMAGANPAMAERSREVMERQLRQMVRLVDDLLDVSRITTGKLMVRRTPVQLQQVIRSAVELAEPFIKSRGHTLQLDLPAEPVWLEADATRLSQVFSNLLNNAAKYTNAGGAIRLDARVAGASVAVRVIDNGIGLTPAMLGRVFDMFTQVDYSLERSNAGLGVGLTLARRLVELHDGRLEAESDGPDQGSTFIATLPLSQTAAPPASAAKPDETTGRRFRILLADDNVDFSSSLATLLRSLGHELLVAEDGLRALEAAPSFQPDFAFLDIGLPGLNGYALARALRANPATGDTVLVAVTGWGQERDRQLAQEAGFDHHLVKPVEPAKIREVLAREWRAA